MSINRYIALLVCVFAIGCKSTKNISKASAPAPEIEKISNLQVNKSQKEQVKTTALFIEANKHKNIGNFNEAEALFLKTLSLDDQVHAAHFELSKLYTSAIQTNPASVKQLFQKAYYHGKKAVEQNQENKWYLLHMAQLYEVNAELDKAIDIYEKLEKQAPNNIEYLSMKAGLLESNKQYEKAIDAHQSIEDKTSINKVSSFQKARLYQLIDKHEKAEDEIKALIQTDSTNIDYHQKLAELFMQQDKEDQAIAQFERMKRIDPKNGLTHLSLYKFYTRKKESQKAFESAHQAFSDASLHIDHKVFTLLNYYQEIDLDTNNKQQRLYAEALTKTLLKTHPESAKAYTMAGDFYLQQEQKKKAVQAFLKATEIDASKYVIWNQLSILQAELEDYEGLVKTAEKSAELFPSQPLPYYFAGIAHFQLKAYEKSIEHLENGASITSDIPLKIQFHAMLGDAFDKLEKHTESDNAFDAALALDSNNTQVLNNYAYYLSVREQGLEKAKKMSKKSLDLNPNSSTFADTYAWILYKLNDFNEAQVWIEKALDWGGSQSAVIVEHYGDILYKNNQKEQALIQWKKAKTLGEDHSEFLDQKIKDEKIYE